jgi:very-short-patch-repair endonuclease
VPVRLERDTVASPWRLHFLDEGFLSNHTLAQRLANDFKVQLPVADEEENDADAEDEDVWLKKYFEAVRQCIRDQKRWEVRDEAALGMFSFQKLAMWEDLGRSQERIKNHDLCRAIAGDHSIDLRGPADLPGEKNLDDKTRPDETHHILDADSSQHAAIVAATREANLVLDGPPGTGKSQTIANIIAEFLAADKTVLFVSEKAAALEVVKRRLDERRLGDFCLELHSHKANKKAVLDELGRCLRLTPECSRDTGDDLKRLSEDRARLNEYVRELHAQRQPRGRSAYQVHGELARLDHLASKSRCLVPDVFERDGDYLRRVTDLLAKLPDCRSVIEEGDRHPWRGCRATVYSPNVRDDVQHHFGRLGKCLEQITEASALLHELGFDVSSSNRGEWLAALESTRLVLSCPQVPAAWFETDARPIAEAVVRLDRQTRQYHQVQHTLPEFDADALKGSDPSSLLGLTAALGGSRPRLLPPIDETVRSLRQRLDRVGRDMRELRQRAEAVDAAEQQVAALLGMTLTPSAVGELHSFAKLAEHIARMKPTRRSWWDHGRRQELQKVMTRCREEARAAQELRTELTARLSPQAFTPENASLVLRASRFRWFLARLLPGWWSLKAQVAAWYAHGTPKTAVLLDDLDKLAAYHRHIDYCRQVREQYAAELVPNEEGQPDWGGTLEGLRSVDRLEQLGDIPATLQAMLSTNGIDREALAVAAAALGHRAASLRQQLKAVGQDYDFGEVRDASSRRFKLAARDLAAWLGAQLESVDRELIAVEGVCCLLAKGRDLATAEWPAKLRIATDLARLRGEITLLSRRLPLGEGTQPVEDRDWSDLGKRAQCLLRFLDTCRGAGQLPPAVVQALTVTEVRDRLANAVQRNQTAHTPDFDESWEFLTSLFDPAEEVSTGIIIDRFALNDLRGWLTERATDAHRINEWLQFQETRRELTEAGVLPILDEVLSGQIKVEEVADTFRARFLRLWLDALYEGVPALRKFATDSHERLIDRFRALDRSSVESAPARIRSHLLTHTDRPRDMQGNVPGSPELSILLRQMNMRRRHLPLRKLFAAIPTLLPRLKPCLMMSPLAVSTYLSPDFQFDLVIFDEASQVRPHDAICAIYRGRQLVVAGDQKQLPPTSFFDSAPADAGPCSEEGDDSGSLKDFESVLDVCCNLKLPRRRLRWHYRSRREGLIAFSNQSKDLYNNELVTFPSAHDVAGNPAIAFEYIAEGRWKTGSGFNAVEARKTAELVLRHFREHPKQSLGVIAFGQHQQTCILDELDRLRRANPDLEDSFREDRDEPFFVKNLEIVQGDERDVIFLSVGYGPDETGRVAMNFGPLNKQGGERRLNVAVTRARERMTVVSSLRAQDIDLSRTTALGVQLLWAYLDYAERGPEALRAAIKEDSNRDFDSPFEREVHEELKRHDLQLHRQVGCGGFRIDLAVVDSRAPGRYLLGIECDGATYHSSATARDRDRLRQEVLEQLGWRICRIWSTDWLRDRAGQVRRVLAALEKAR